MKKDLHPPYISTKVICNGCGTQWETNSTVKEIDVEICSQCHPYYTGKQKLVDVAGRVDKFKARQAAASSKQAERAQQASKQTRKQSGTGKSKPSQSKGASRQSKT